MVQEADAHGCRRGLDGLGQLTIVGRRSGVSAGMIMGENKAAGLVGQSSLNDFADIHSRLVRSAPLEALSRRHRVLRVHEGDINLLFGQTLKLCLEVGCCLSCGTQQGLAGRLGFQKSGSKGSNEGDEGRCLRPDPVNPLQGSQVRLVYACQGPKSLQKLLGERLRIPAVNRKREEEFQKL